MRIVHVQKVTGIGGSERHLLSLLPGLIARGHDCRMAVLAAGDHERFVEPLDELGVPVDVIPIGPDLDLRALRALRRAVRNADPDILHTHLIHGDLYGQLTARLLGLTSVSSVHATHGFLRRPHLRFLARRAGAIADGVIAISEHVARFLSELRLADPGKVTVIRYGIDPAGWELVEADRQSARVGWGIDDSVVVGVASRLFPAKGHDFLLDAFSDAWEKDNGLQLLIAGDGPLRGELEAKARALPASGAIRFLGYVNDIGRFMGATDVMVFPTMPGFGEGFGLAALEAMAAGRPLVATRLDSLPEIVVEDETGWLVEPGATDQLASSLLRLSQDLELRDRMGRAGRARVKTEFSLDRMIDTTAALYDEVARA